ncbi:MAG: hypothetical protein PHI83_05310 [Sphaerochaetaceae bacterium]|nr:hypothetical protein [Sphaerochaetaceae bacterium]
MPRKNKAAFLSLVLALILMTSLHAQEATVGIAVDSSALVDLFRMDKGVQLDIEARCTITEDFSIRMPLVFTFSSTSFLFDSGLFLVYYPWLTGPFAGFSMLQYGVTDSLGSYRILALSEILVGYTLNLDQHWFLEASLTLRDPAGAYEEEYSLIKGVLPVYSTNRIRLLCGYEF